MTIKGVCNSECAAGGEICYEHEVRPMLEEAEAENVRLRAERETLLHQLAYPSDSTEGQSFTRMALHQIETTRIAREREAEQRAQMLADGWRWRKVAIEENDDVALDMAEAQLDAALSSFPRRITREKSDAFLRWFEENVEPVFPRQDAHRECEDFQRMAEESYGRALNAIALAKELWGMVPEEAFAKIDELLAEPAFPRQEDAKPHISWRCPSAWRCLETNQPDRLTAEQRKADEDKHFAVVCYTLPAGVDPERGPAFPGQPTETRDLFDGCQKCGSGLFFLGYPIASCVGCGLFESKCTCEPAFPGRTKPQ